MISVRKVTKEYHLDENAKITPIKDVDLEVNQGEFLMIVGRSGSGKTTLLNLCAGLIKPTSGQVFIDGSDISRMTDGQLSALRSKKIGFVFQFQSLFSNLTIRENVAMPASNVKTSGNPKRRAEELLRMVGLNDRMNVYPKQLSAGELRRVAIARALMNKPELLLADEPTADLDEQTERTIVALLHQIHRSGITILMITHNMDLVPDCTRALTVENGALKPFLTDEIKVPKNVSSAREIVEHSPKTVSPTVPAASEVEKETAKTFSSDEEKSRKVALKRQELAEKTTVRVRPGGPKDPVGQGQKLHGRRKLRVSSGMVVGLAVCGVALAVVGIRFVPGLASSLPSQVQGTNVVAQSQTTQTANLLPVDAGLGKEFALRLGQTAAINEEKMSIEFAEVTGDGRCPVGAKCYSPGNISFIVEVTTGGDNSSSINLPLVQPGQNDSTTATFDKYTLTFRVDPYPVAGKTISKSEYILNIIISIGDEVFAPLKSNRPKGPSM